MKKLQTWLVIFLALVATPELLAQNKMSKEERRVMRESVFEDKIDQKNYAHKQKRNEERIDKREKRTEKKGRKNKYREPSPYPSSYIPSMNSEVM